MKKLSKIGYKLSCLLVLVMLFTFTGKTCFAHGVSLEDNYSLSTSAEKSLAGKYTIGGDSADFPSMEEAIERLKQYGVSSAVEFSIAAGVWKGNFSLPYIYGVSEVNSISFSGVKGKSKLISENGEAVLILKGANYIRFENLSFENSQGEVIRMDGGCNYNVFQKCTFSGGSELLVLDGVKECNSFNSFYYNYFLGSESAVQLKGGSSKKDQSNAFAWNMVDCKNVSFDVENQEGLILAHNKLAGHSEGDEKIAQTKTSFVYNNQKIQKKLDSSCLIAESDLNIQKGESLTVHKLNSAHGHDLRIKRKAENADLKQTGKFIATCISSLGMGTCDFEPSQFDYTVVSPVISKVDGEYSILRGLKGGGFNAKFVDKLCFTSLFDGVEKENNYLVPVINEELACSKGFNSMISSPSMSQYGCSNWIADAAIEEKQSKRSAEKAILKIYDSKNSSNPKFELSLSDCEKLSNSKKDCFGKWGRIDTCRFLNLCGVRKDQSIKLTGSVNPKIGSIENSDTKNLGFGNLLLNQDCDVSISVDLFDRFSLRRIDRLIYPEDCMCLLGLYVDVCEDLDASIRKSCADVDIDKSVCMELMGGPFREKQTGKSFSYLCCGDVNDNVCEPDEGPLIPPPENSLSNCEHGNGLSGCYKMTVAFEHLCLERGKICSLWKYSLPFAYLNSGENRDNFGWLQKTEYKYVVEELGLS
ncbi:MAG: hypothetical protein ACEPOZ_14920 [Marinifilaceae bacterium]